ncbi:MAG: hypothetical protein K2I80_04450 [Ruminococcus sp.]|nr:hypothetical protein [Ruminococcus sp.]MDE6848114.1 hypothetical protein [Ruminococcus sp.]
MAWLKISNGSLNFRINKISQYDLSEFSLKNQYTGEKGNTIIYPVRMHKKRISVTAEFSEIEYKVFADIVKNPEFECEYRTPYVNEPLSGIFTVTSDITSVKIIPETSLNWAVYAVSFTIEEV